MVDVDVKNAIFITSIGYAPDEVLSEPDYCLHGGMNEKKLLDNGGSWVVTDFPIDKFHTNQNESLAGKKMLYETIKNPEGKRYFPLFNSYTELVKIYGENVRIAMTCLVTALEMAVSENLDGVVVGVGTLNHVIDRSQIKE